MLIILFTLISITLSKQLTLVEKDTIVFKDEPQDITKFGLRLREQRQFNFIRQGKTINLQVLNMDDQKHTICNTYHRDIRFDDFTKHTLQLESSTMTNEEIPQLHKSDPSYYLSTPILVNMVHLNQGFLAVSSDYQLFLFLVKENPQKKTGFEVTKEDIKNFNSLRSSNQTEIPQLVYCIITGTTYVIYKNQVLAVTIKDNKLENIQDLNVTDFHNNRSYVGTVKIHSNKMYVPLGSDGLDVYAINTDGTLIYVKNIDSQDLYKQSKSIFIIDVEIKFDKIFVLDSHSGVVVLDQRSLKLVEDFGQIIEYGCKMIKEFNEQTLFLLCQRNIITYVNEYGLHKNDWFFLRRHYLNGQYFDIDVTHDFAILRGVDAHRVIYHSIWHGFLQEDDETLHEENTHYSLEEEYLYLPHLQGLEFYSKYYGEIDNNNISHPFILGMTTHDLIEVPYYEQIPRVICQTNDRNQIGRKRRFDVVINSTFCDQKREYYEKNDNPLQLSICEQRVKFEVEIKNAFEFKFNTEELASIVIGLTILLVLLAMGLAYLYGKYKKKEEKLNQEISGFDFSMDQSQVEKSGQSGL